MTRRYLSINEAVADSPVGPGSITDFTDVGYPRVNGIAVSWLDCQDGTIFDPHGVRDGHLTQRAQAQQKGPQQ